MLLDRQATPLDVKAYAAWVLINSRRSDRVAIDYSEKTYFTRGVVKTNLRRLPAGDRLRMIGRALARRL